MANKVVRRSADITPKEALAGLRAKFPGYRISSFDLVADGSAYEAKLVTSEFPPPSGNDDDDGGAEAPESEGPPAPDGDGDGDDSGSDGPPAPKKDKGGDKGGMKAVEHKLDAIMQALGIDPMGGAGPDDPGAGPPPPGADPGMAGGPMPPAPDPLPPPAKPHGAPMGGGGGLGTPFSRVAAVRRSFVVWREPDADGSLPSVKQAVAEITAQLPATHKVAQIVKRPAKIEGGKPTQVYVVGITTK